MERPQENIPSFIGDLLETELFLTSEISTSNVYSGGGQGELDTITRNGLSKILISVDAVCF